MVSLYSKKSVDVERVLLVRYPESMSLRKLAKEASVSLGQAFKVTKTLINERIAIRDSLHSEFKLMNPYSLIKRWATSNNFAANTKFIEYYASENDIDAFLNKLRCLNEPEYALTGLTGAMLIAPFVRPTNVHIYIKTEEDAKMLANQLNLMPIEENGNIKFSIASSEGVFYGANRIDGVNVVSDIQLYVDLLNYPGRGEEAANEILKKIENRWNQAMIY
jgi:hypothetical protein